VKTSLLLLLLYISSSYTNNELIDVQKVKNFHQVSEDLYRSGQPQHSGMHELSAMGVKTIINLRNSINDRHEIRNTDLKEVHIRIGTKKLNYQDVLNTMIAFRDSEKPMLVHCRRGSDRTGCMVAAYRMVFMGWEKEKAIKGLMDKDLGYLDGMFPNILQVIKDLDVNQLKSDMQRL